MPQQGPWACSPNGHRDSTQLCKPHSGMGTKANCKWHTCNKILLRSQTPSFTETCSIRHLLKKRWESQERERFSICSGIFAKNIIFKSSLYVGFHRAHSIYSMCFTETGDYKWNIATRDKESSRLSSYWYNWMSSKWLLENILIIYYHLMVKYLPEVYLFDTQTSDAAAFRDQRTFRDGTWLTEIGHW